MLHAGIQLLRGRSSAPRKPKEEPSGLIAQEFRRYVQNEIPVRFIDPSAMKFVKREDVFSVFQEDIAKIGDDEIDKRASRRGWEHQHIYVYQRQVVLKELMHQTIKYVVFSHRWHADGEPTFQDISSGKQRKIVGFDKLKRYCQKAKALGYRLIWSDTCCIDKTNSAELCEAVQAMYKWYANAYLCIVHLADSTKSSDFGREEWFTRGWTLQELLAPKRVKFYNKDWYSFTSVANDKEDAAILSALYHTTGIPEAAIIADNSNGIRSQSVWEIMSWASKRKTTRIEDIAYSLIGLFGVHLTIAYGEGETAFSRLVEAIMHRKARWDIFAWVGQASAYHAAIPSSPACYPPFEPLSAGKSVGVKNFSMTSDGLRLLSLPLIPVKFVLGSVGIGGTCTAVLQPTPSPEFQVQFGTITVTCGRQRLRRLGEAENLAICILNYEAKSGKGKVAVGKEYICFLLHSDEPQDPYSDKPAWSKLSTEDLVRIHCQGLRTQTASDSSTSNASQEPSAGEDRFLIALKHVYIE
ncbi:heterokaryon incompatibility protein-domain-containing protein [Phlebopus sp. FC_14]|nr:heterokaryon incompatibility protein-domain-containing protein [Phlebopus sp. FC_14]